MKKIQLKSEHLFVIIMTKRYLFSNRLCYVDVVIKSASYFTLSI